MVPMSIIGHKSALAELAQASTAFGYEVTEERLSSQDEINSELREAGGAFTEYFDMMLPDAPTPEILDTKNQKQSDESTPSITIGTVKLYELYGGEEPRNCDIVFIHGLNGDAFSTWQSDKMLWPKHLISKDFPHARVFSIGYEAPVGSFPDPLFADTIAENLLGAMTKARHAEQVSYRPIIWVAHSLGGLLLKAALVISESKRDIEPLQATINNSTVGIIFLGTPHHARSTIGWTNVLSRIKAVVKRSSDSTQEIDNAARHTDHFTHLLSSFDQNLEQSRVSIYSFYETKEMVAGGSATLVTQHDNALYHPSEEVKFLDGNHITMCKFQNAFENGYVQITRALRAILTRNLEFRPIHRSSNDILQSSGVLPAFGPEKNALVTKGDFDPDVDMSATMASSAISQVTQSRKLRRLKKILTAPVMGRKQIPPRFYGTCEWVRSSLEDWLKFKTFLVVKGPSGSGKSVIANYIIEYLQDRTDRGEGDDSARPYTLHFFFNIQADVKQAGREMLHQFLLQLLEVNPSLVRHFPDEKVFGRVDRKEDARWLIEDGQEPQSAAGIGAALPRTVSNSSDENDKTQARDLISDLDHPPRPSSPFGIEDLIAILVSILRDTEVSQSYLVIDGLDECNDLSLSLVLRLLDHIRRIEGTKVCLTYCQEITLEIKLNEHVTDALPIWIPSGTGFLDDIDSYIGRQLASLTEQQRLPSSKLREIEGIFRKTHLNTYLCITLITKTAANLPNVKCVNEFLEVLKKPSLSDVSDSSHVKFIYDWILSYLSRERDPVALLALCFVAIASRPLTIGELSNFLAADESCLRKPRDDQPSASTVGLGSPSRFSCWLNCSLEADPAVKDMSALDNTKRLNLQIWLDSELFGLITVRGGLVSLMHPSLKESIQSYLSRECLMNYVQRDLAAACLVLLCLHRRGNDRFRHHDGVHVPPIEVLDYAITNWSEHLREAQESALDLQPLVKELWKSRQFQPLLLKLAGKNYPPKSIPSLSCVLSAFNLHFNLEIYYLTPSSAETEKQSSVLSMELRYAAANAAFESIKVLQRCGHDLTARDEGKKNLMDYAIWTRNEEFSSKLEKLANIRPTDVPAIYVLSTIKNDSDFRLQLDNMKREMDFETFHRRQSDLLNSAVQLGKASFVFTLIPDIDSVQAQLALERAVESEQLLILRKLLEHFSQRGQKSIQFGKSLRMAAKKADVNCTDLLLKYGADCNEVYNNEPSALHFGAQSGRLELVELLVRFRARKSATDSRGRKPIHWAASQGHSRIVQFLVSPSADQDRSGKSALFLACKCESLPTIRVLLEYGASVNTADLRGRTPLHVAALNGTRDVVRLLLAEGADVGAKSDTWTTSLHEAALGGWTTVVEELIAAGATIDARDRSKQTVLHYACRSSNPSIDLLNVLLQHGADPKDKDDQEQLALHFAVKEGNPAIVLALTENFELSIYEIDKYGKTALHNAAQTGNTAVAECLLSVIRNSPDLDGSSAAGKIQGYINHTDNKGKTALHYAVERAPIGLFNLLLDNGADPNSRDNEGNSVLHDLCSSENPLDFVQKLEKLLINGFLVYQINKRGATPVLCALQGISKAGSKRLNKWEELNNFRKSSAGFKGTRYEFSMIEFWKILNAGRIGRMWKRKEKIRLTPMQRWASLFP